MKSKILMLAFLLSMIVGSAWAQTITVKGIVVDEYDDPVVGVTVRLKSDATKGASTDLNGAFTLQAKQGELLIVSYVGYKTQEIAAAPELRIKLQPDSELLDELVVVGYGTRKLAATSASVVKVGAADIREKPTANVLEAAQGKVAGLQVYTSSGEPSETSSIRLHGKGSLDASSTPLYIIDGMPVSSGTLQSLNPNDFESVQFLKDAAATSIYGARAANGVVYIVTKKGSAGERSSITVRGQYGISTLANTAYYDKLMNADELIDYQVLIGKMKKADVEAFKKENPHNTQWYKYYYQPAPTYQGDITISGGAGRTNYYISGNYFKQQGLREGSDYWKTNGRINLNTTLNKYISMGLNTSVSYDHAETSPYARNSTGGGGLAVLAPPYFTPYQEDGSEWPIDIPGWDRYTPKYFISKNPSYGRTFNLNSSGHIQITPIEGLKLRSQASLEFIDYTGYSKSYPTYIDNSGRGRASRSFSRTLAFTNTNTAEYRFSIQDDHDFVVLAGHEYIRSDYEGFNASGGGLQDDRLMLLGAATQDKDVGESFSQYAFLSFFGQFSYSLYDKYFLDATIRNDASSRFGANKRNGLFWSAGLLWKMKEEAFLKDVDWLSTLDIRLSSGTQGNAGIGNYDALPLIGISGMYEAGSAWRLGNPGNPNLGWESQTKTTLGIQARFIDDRFGVNLEVYRRITDDMLMSVPYPYTTGFPRDQYGFAAITENVAKYQNAGIDLAIDANILRHTDYTLDAYLNFNYNKDKILSLFGGLNHWILPNYGFGYIVGQPVTFIYPLLKGVNSETGHLEWYLPGDDISVTQKDPSKVTNVFSSTLEQNTGIPQNTPMVGGFGISGSYKGFYAQLDFSFALGKHMISNDRFFYENAIFAYQGLNQAKNAGDYWQKPGDQTEFPSLAYMFNSPYGDGWQTHFDSKLISDASFMRLKNATLGYNVPRQLLRGQNAIQGCKIYVTGRNLLTFTKYTGVDPEVDSNLSLGANPNTKQFVVGAEISF